MAGLRREVMVVVPRWRQVAIVATLGAMLTVAAGLVDQVTWRLTSWQTVGDGPATYYPAVPPVMPPKQLDPAEEVARLVAQTDRDLDRFLAATSDQERAAAQRALDASQAALLAATGTPAARAPAMPPTRCSAHALPW